MQLLMPASPPRPASRSFRGRAAFTCLTLLMPLLSSASYTLQWSDEFDYTGLPDPARWGYDVGGGGWGNNELQYYTENRQENARVEDGRLVIEAVKEAYGGRDYTSARLVSRDKGDWLYGRFEIRAKLPAGRGTWPAIWMLSTDWVYGGWPRSGEIDIMEHVGYDMQRIHGTIHTDDFNHTRGTQIGNSILASNVDTEFHVYAMEWRPHRIDIFMDGLRYFTVTDNGTGVGAWPFDQRFHLLMNIAVGGDWGGAQGVDDSIFPQRMEVDYVRVYSIDDYAYADAIPAGSRIQMQDFSDQDGVRLEATEDLDGEVNAGYLAHGDWLEFRIETETAGRYAVDLRYASPNGTAKVWLSTDSESVLSGAFPATGDWQNWNTAGAGEINLPKGTVTLRLTMEAPSSEDLNLNWMELRLLEATGGDRPYGIFSDFPASEFWADTGDFLGPAYLADYPWVYLPAMNRHVYAAPSDTSGAWIYIPRGTGQ